MTDQSDRMQLPHDDGVSAGGQFARAPQSHDGQSPTENQPAPAQQPTGDCAPAGDQLAHSPQSCDGQSPTENQPVLTQQPTGDRASAGDPFARTRKLLGDDAVERLAAAHVCVFGVGGVGGYVVEGLARAGVGALDVVDSDTVDVTNLNRQVIATWDTVGRSKVDVAAERIRAINPACRVTTHECFYLPETRSQFDFSRYDYIVDAVDTVSAKLDLAVAAHEAGTPLISSMGTGDKLDPTQLEVADIYATSVCPLARIMRKELRRRGIPALKCVYSKEEPARAGSAIAPTRDQSGAGAAPAPLDADAKGAQPCKDGLARDEESPRRRKSTPGSVSFVPSVAGLIIAGEVVKDLIR